MYIILSIVTAGFIGMLVLEDIIYESDVSAKVIVVDRTGGGNYTYIQDAINNSNDGDTIYVKAGNYPENVLVNKSVTIIGASKYNTTISSSKFGDVVKITADWVNISGFNLKKITAAAGNGLMLSYANNCRVENNNFSKVSLRVSYSNQNTIKNNTFPYGGVIFSYRSNLNIIEDNYFRFFTNGIELQYSNNNLLRNNTCYFGGNGIKLYFSDNNKLIANNCTRNDYNGIFIRFSKNNTIADNLVKTNIEYDMKIEMSSSIKILNNTMAPHGLNLFYNPNSASLTIDINNTVNGKPLMFLKEQTSGTYSQESGQIIIVNCSGITLKNQNISNTGDAVFVRYSNNLTFENNNLSNNEMNGLILFLSEWNTIIDSRFDSNTESGIEIIGGHHNRINNSVIRLNDDYGIFNSGSNYNKVTNSTFYDNWRGVWVEYSNYNRYEYNSFDTNKFEGIFLETWANYNNVINNNFVDNLYGVRFDQAGNNRIYNNDYSGNTFAVHMRGNDNSINNNNMTDNVVGITIESGANTIFENIISRNTNRGITILQGVSNNKIYHNQFLSNVAQARDTDNSNYWSVNNEGNYWSDYTGSDSGANGRPVGDGIGDTDIPHLDLDNYPFVNPDGWIYPSRTIMFDPGDLDLDGNYTVKWNYTKRIDGYVLEEDTSSSFDSPVQLYDGLDFSFDLTNKPNGTYYYRVKTYKGSYETPWSNIEAITVDQPPSHPFGLSVIEVTASSVKLQWDPNPELDIQGYRIYRNITNAYAGGPFQLIQTVPATQTTATLSQLSDKTTYFFVLKAFDNNRNSTYSNSVWATTFDETPPNAPKGLIANAVDNYNIDILWSKNLEQDLSGYIIFMNNTKEGPDGDFHVIDDIIGTETKLTATGLAEQTDYYFKMKAYDNIPNESPFSVVVHATTPDLIPPAKPSGLTIVDPTHDSLTLSWNSNKDHDLIGYNIFRKNKFGSYDQLNSEPLEETGYIDSGLTDSTVYYYKVQAVDDAELRSLLSNEVSSKTLIGARTPMVNNSIPNLSILEDSYDDSSIDLHFWFMDQNKDPLQFKCEGQERIKVTVYQDNGTVVLQPAKNWNGKETLTFHASDGKLNISDEVIVTVLPVNDPPGPVKITSPANGADFVYGNGIDFSGECSDADLIYGDTLKFKWLTGDGVVLGNERNLTSIGFPVGEHHIILEVIDNSFSITKTSINITISEKAFTPDTVKPEEKSNGLVYASIIVAVITIVILIFLFLLLRRRGNRAEGKPASPDVIKEPVAQSPQYYEHYEPASHNQSHIPENSRPPQEIYPTQTAPVLKETLQPLQQLQQCENCGGQMQYFSIGNRYYCTTCNKYD